MTLLDNTITEKPVVLVVVLKIYKRTTIPNTNKKYKEKTQLKIH